MYTVILFILILSLLVIAHEGGHFFAAKWAKMKVYEFALGFPPRAFGWYKDPKTGKFRFVFGSGSHGLKKTVSGDEPTDPQEFPSTLYSINWLPLGGFVRIKGENGDAAKDPDSFGYQSAGKRIFVLSAGVIMNFLLAALILGVGFMVGLPADLSSFEDEGAVMVGEPTVAIQQVLPDSPAAQAGFSYGDALLTVNGEIVQNSAWVKEYIDTHAEDQLTFIYERGDEQLVSTVTPALLEGEDDGPHLGVVLGDVGIIRYPWYLAIPKGFVAAAVGVINILLAFGYLIAQLVTGGGFAFDVSGPVGIAVIIGDSARLGLNYLLNVTAMISLSLAVINILPIPALDGGRILFVLIEKITGKPVPMKFEQIAHTIGFVLLMGLVVVVTWRDIVALF